MRPTPSRIVRRRRSATRRHSGGRAAGRARSRAEATARTAGSSRCTCRPTCRCMQYADDRALRETLYRASVTRASEFGKPEWDNTPLIARDPASCAARWRSCSASPTSPRSRSRRRWPSRRAQVLGFLDDLARARAAVRASATCDGAARVRARPSSGIAELAGLGPRLRLREAARQALRLLRPGSEAVLPRGRGAAGPVPRGRDALRPEDRARRRRRSGTRTCASSTMRDARGRPGRPVLPRPLRARRPSAAAPGWTTRSRRRRKGERRADAGRLPHLQLLARRSAASRRCSRTTR